MFHEGIPIRQASLYSMPGALSTELLATKEVDCTDVTLCEV